MVAVDRAADPGGGEGFAGVGVEMVDDELAETSGGEAFVSVGQAVRRPGRITAALELVEEAEPIARALGSGDLLSFILAFQAHVLLQARLPGGPDALSVAEEAVAVGNSDGWWATIAACTLAHAAFNAGDPHRTVDVLMRIGGHRLDQLPQVVMLSWPGARFRCCHRSVFPGRSPNPPYPSDVAR